MSSGQVASARPVFVFPGKLDFYLEDQTTHKRVMTIYNPYDLEIAFKVLCNNPNKYTVVEPEGRISAQKCADVVVRHVAVSPAAVQQTDKFRIHIFEDLASGEVVGKRDILATLHPGAPDPSEGRHSSSLPHRAGNQLTGSGHVGQFPADEAPAFPPSRHYEQQSPNMIAIFAAVVCIVALFLPTEGESALKDYPYLQLTMNQKLVFAYVLGLVTMAILRTA